MIEILPDTNDRFVLLKLSGLISEADFDACVEKLAPVIGNAAIQGLLFDWAELEGWSKGAKTVGTLMGLRMWAGVRRVALVADDRWDDEKLRIADVYRAADVQRFEPGERAQALAWLRQG